MGDQRVGQVFGGIGGRGGSSSALDLSQENRKIVKKMKIELLAVLYSSMGPPVGGEMKKYTYKKGQLRGQKQKRANINNRFSSCMGGGGEGVPHQRPLGKRGFDPGLIAGGLKKGHAEPPN